MLPIQPIPVSYVATNIEIAIKDYILGAAQQEATVLFLDDRNVVIKVEKVIVPTLFENNPNLGVSSTFSESMIVETDNVNPNVDENIPITTNITSEQPVANISTDTLIVNYVCNYLGINLMSS